MALSNLPPGVTNAMIEEQAGADIEKVPAPFLLDETKPKNDVDILYKYANFGAKCSMFGLRVAASRVAIIVRDSRNQLVVSSTTIDDADKMLQKLIDAGLYEHSEF